MNRLARRWLTVTGLAVSLVGALVLPAFANHAWGNYHWARTANPFTIKLGDNVSSAWDSYLRTASSDWSKSTVLDTTIVAGSTSPKNCRPTSGRGEVCNATYGNTGWLGVAQVWASGDHITQGVVKLNDTYFSTAQYNTPAWRQLVTCQEVGHIFGLDHQDENFDNKNLGTCMDYTNDPSTNLHPNQHDYDQLQTIYSHLDSSTTILSAPASANSDLNHPSDWGKLVHRSANGHSAVYEKDLGDGNKLITHVFWAEPLAETEGDAGAHADK